MSVVRGSLGVEKKQCKKCRSVKSDAIPRQVSETKYKVLCWECADIARAVGPQVRGTEPPERP